MRATSAARFAFVAELVSFWVLALTLSWLGTLHSSFETNECRVGVSALLSKRELGKANSLLGRARGLVKPKWSYWILGNHHKYGRPIFERECRVVQRSLEEGDSRRQLTPFQ
ncbi:hypothetical protein QYF36_018637 [Acer negundo]|nr:hypothetical protein QYF36_018637 [Acer negundo]